MASVSTFLAINSLCTLNVFYGIQTARQSILCNGVYSNTDFAMFMAETKSGQSFLSNFFGKVSFHSESLFVLWFPSSLWPQMKCCSLHITNILTPVMLLSRLLTMCKWLWVKCIFSTWTRKQIQRYQFTSKLLCLVSCVVCNEAFCSFTTNLLANSSCWLIVKAFQCQFHFPIYVSRVCCSGVVLSGLFLTTSLCVLFNWRDTYWHHTNVLKAPNTHYVDGRVQVMFLVGLTLSGLTVSTSDASFAGCVTQSHAFATC